MAGTYAATNSKKGITAGDVAMICDQITDPSLSFTAETEDIVDARNNLAMLSSTLDFLLSRLVV